MGKSANWYSGFQCDYTFYKQIILQNGLPFAVKLPEHSLDIRRMTEAQLHAELERGYADIKAGRILPMAEAFAEARGE